MRFFVDFLCTGENSCGAASIDEWFALVFFLTRDGDGELLVGSSWLLGKMSVKSKGLFISWIRSLCLVKVGQIPWSAAGFLVVVEICLTLRDLRDLRQR